MQTIGKIPDIDTDTARETILARLLKDPQDYIQSCRQVLAEEHVAIEAKDIVTLGHKLSDYKKLVDEHAVDLLVVNTKDQGQLAMHGVAYSLSVELRATPLLLL